jgi:hypothetical protein
VSGIVGNDALSFTVTFAVTEAVVIELTRVDVACGVKAAADESVEPAAGVNVTEYCWGVVLPVIVPLNPPFSDLAQIAIPGESQDAVSENETVDVPLDFNIVATEALSGAVPRESVHVLVMVPAIATVAVCADALLAVNNNKIVAAKSKVAFFI